MARALEFDIGLVALSGADADGHQTIQPDIYGREAGADPFEAHHPWGFRGVPHDPELAAGGDINPAKAAQCQYAWEGDKGHAWALEDPRLVPKLPLARPGQGLCYGGKVTQPAFLEFDADTGSYILYVPYAFNGDTPTKASSIAVNVRNAGAESIELVHGDGMSITMLAGGKNSIVLKNKAGDAYLELNDEGIVGNGNTKVNGAMTVGTPAALPVALAPPLLSYLTALEATLSTISGATLPPTTPAVVAFQAATAAFKAALSAQFLSGA